MQNRRGVSFVEVLVSAVVLAVGIGGAMTALGACARLRERALAREALVALARDAVARAEREGCAVPVGIAELAQSDGRRAIASISDGGAGAEGGVRVLDLEVLPAPGHPGRTLRAHLSLRCG